MWRGEILSVESLGHSSRGKYPYFWIYPNSTTIRCRINWDSLYAKKTSSIRSTFSIQYRLVTDRQTNGQTHSRCRSLCANRQSARYRYIAPCRQSIRRVADVVRRRNLRCADTAAGPPVNSSIVTWWPCLVWTQGAVVQDLLRFQGRTSYEATKPDLSFF